MAFGEKERTLEISQWRRLHLIRGMHLRKKPMKRQLVERFFVQLEKVPEIVIDFILTQKTHSRIESAIGAIFWPQQPVHLRVSHLHCRP
jgi:hypothetical protein